MRATMQDIARECGVTKMTVSRVLRGRAGVKAVTREKIHAAAKRLNYEINTLAQKLNSNRSGFIGVATPFKGMLGSPYFGAVFEGFQLAMKDADWDIALFDTDSDAFNSGAKLARVYRQRKVDGLLVVGLHSYDRFVDTSEHLGIPMVVVGEQPQAPTLCSVSCDDYLGIQLLCEHLYGLGHRRIAFVEGPQFLATADQRKRGFVDFCKSKRLKNPPWYIHPGFYTMDCGREAGLNLLRAEPRPTAIIGANDMTAFGVMESARELNLAVPHDFSLAGFDDLPSAAVRFPTLTTIHQPVKEMAQRGATLLMEAMKLGDLPSAHIVMDVALVVRESTGRVPVGIA